MIPNDSYKYIRDRIENLKDALDLQNNVCRVYENCCEGFCPAFDVQSNKCLFRVMTKKMYESLYNGDT